MTETAKLSIEGMHCGACVRRVSSALEALPGVGVEAVEIGSATVSLDEGIPTETIVAAVEAIGFPARVAS
jgi:copper chaperone